MVYMISTFLTLLEIVSLNLFNSSGGKSPSERERIRKGRWVRFKYSEDAEYNDLVTAVRLDNP